MWNSENYPFYSLWEKYFEKSDTYHIFLKGKTFNLPNILDVPGGEQDLGKILSGKFKGDVIVIEISDNILPLKKFDKNNFKRDIKAIELRNKLEWMYFTSIDDEIFGKVANDTFQISRWDLDFFFQDGKREKIIEYIESNELEGGFVDFIRNDCSGKPFSLDLFNKVFQKEKDNDYIMMRFMSFLNEKYDKNPLILSLLHLSDFKMKSPIYMSKMYNNLSLIYLKNGELDLARKFSFKSVHNKLIPKHEERTFLDNQYKSVKYLEPTKIINPTDEVETDYIDEKRPELGRYNSMNPSIIKISGGYLVNLRTVNYHFNGFGRYDWRDGSGKIITKNILIHYDNDFKVIKTQKIIEPEGVYVTFDASAIKGLEDVRLAGIKDGKITFLATSCSVSPIGRPSICIGTIPYDLSLDELVVEKLYMIPSPSGDLGRCEKNHLPFYANGELFSIYSYDPLVICKVNEEYKYEKVQQTMPQINCGHFRGSARPVPYKGNLLIITHQVLSLEWRTYVSNFVLFDTKFNMLKVSPIFKMIKKENSNDFYSIEYISGMEYDEKNRMIIITLGLMDGMSRICFVPEERVDEILWDVNDVYN
jgi:hypothetical protein